jgi:hypothetical protein
MGPYVDLDRGEGVATAPQECLPPFPQRVADSLMLVALANPRGRWSKLLKHAVAAGCLLDLESIGRIGIDSHGLVVLTDGSATGSTGHDLVLRNIEDGRVGGPGRWISALSVEVPSALRSDAEARNEIGDRRRYGWGPWMRFETQIGEGPYVVGLAEELGHVYEGTSDAPLATAVFSLCAAARLPELVPGVRSRRSVYRRARQLPDGAVTRELRDVVASMFAVPTSGG